MAENAPEGAPVVDVKTGLVQKTWLRYLSNLASRIVVLETADADTTETTPSVSATVTPSELSVSNDTNITATLDGMPAFALLQRVVIRFAWAGILSLVRGGTASDLSATGGANQVLQQSTVGGAVTVGTLDAASVATGQLALARGGTNADLSASGGASKFLRQNSAGAAVDVVRPAVADLSDGSHVIVDTGSYADPAWVTSLAASKLTGQVAIANGGTGAATAAGARTALLIKAERVTTGSIGAGLSALVTLTWAAAFADANYTVQASVVDATAAVASLRVVHIETISATAVAVRVENTSAGALTGVLHVTAIHD